MKLKCPEKECNLCVWSLLGKLDVWGNGVNLLQKLCAVFCLLDDKGVIHIHKTQP